MKINKKTFMAAGCMLLSLSMLIGCQSDDIAGIEEETAQVYTYHLSTEVDVAQSTTQGKQQTRALSEDASSVLRSAWTQTDKLIAYCLSDNDKSTLAGYNLLTANGNGKAAGFSGDLKSVNPIKVTDNLCFFYPGQASQGNKQSIAAVNRIVEKGVVFHEKQPTIKHLVELNLSHQDGTIATIGEKYDYQWAKTTPTAVNGNDIRVKVGPLQRKIAIWGLRFADANGNILKSIDSLYISNVKSNDVFDLGTGEFVTDNPNDESTNIVISPAGGTKLSSEGGKYTYAAVLPGNYTDVLIMAYVGKKCFARTYNTADFEANKVYRTDVLQMEEVNPKPYVEVQGLKWATGNFIHYEDPKTLKEYWGIAPTQWWISQRAVENDKKETVSSQFISSPKQDKEDLDLFRYGDIKRALEVAAEHYKQGSKEIAKKFYSEARPLAQPITDQSEAEYGDIVWYYTNKNPQKYRMPTKAELRTLYDNAHVMPGFCYTDYGTKVYGAYFYTSKTGEPRKKTFPTRPHVLHKYSNVTAQVRANKGLFLPITGRRMVGNLIMGERDMNYGAAYGQYMSSTSSTSLFSMDLFFGPTKWNFSAKGKGKAKAIRPIWDESSSTTEFDPVFEPFKDIQ